VAAVVGDVGDERRHGDDEHDLSEKRLPPTKLRW